MKKIISLGMALAMCFCLAIPAFATTPVTGVDSNNTDGKDLTAEIDFQQPDTVYSVDIAWEAMEFTYTSKAVWDVDSLQYQGGTQSWTATGDTVSITNKSNAAIKATASGAMNPATKFTDVGINFAPSVTDGQGTAGTNVTKDLTLNSAATDLTRGVTGAATHGQFQVSLSGEPSNVIADETSAAIGSLTITISAVT